MVPLPLLLSSSSRRQVGGCWGMLCPWGMPHLLFFLLLSFRRSFANGVCYAPVVCYAPGVCPMLLSSFSFLFQLCDGCYQWLLVVIGGYWWLLVIIGGYLPKDIWAFSADCHCVAMLIRSFSVGLLSWRSLFCSIGSLTPRRSSNCSQSSGVIVFNVHSCPFLILRSHHIINGSPHSCLHEVKVWRRIIMGLSSM